MNRSDNYINLPIYNVLASNDEVQPYMLVLADDILIEKDDVICDEPQKVVWILQTAFNVHAQIEEHVWLICLDNAMKAIGLFEIAHGTPSSAVVSPTNIFRRALCTNATSIIIAHNHTSGNAKPSSVDETMTENIVRAGKIIDIPLKDHIIIGDDTVHVSMREQMPELFES